MIIYCHSCGTSLRVDAGISHRDAELDSGIYSNTHKTGMTNQNSKVLQGTNNKIIKIRLTD